jgi:ADP-ribose pyrophosphatase
MPPAPEPLLSSRRLFQGRVVGLRVDTVELAKGGRQVQATREVVEHAPTIVVVPLDGKGNVLLVKQYRHATGETLLEAPAGGIEPGESPEEAVTRELREETGYAPGRVQRLAGFWIAPGWCTEYMHAYIAEELEPSELPGDEDEVVRVAPVPLAQVPELIRRGKICDAKSIAALLMALYLFPSTS